MLAGVIVIPLLIRAIGVPRFGVIALCWAMIAYFSLFDFGLGRALTLSIAQKIAAHRVNEVPELAWITYFCMVVIALCVDVPLIIAIPRLVGHLQLPTGLAHEASEALYFLVGAMPILVLGAGLRGFLEGYQRFDLVNLVRLPLGLSTFVLPVAVLPFSKSIAVIVETLVTARLVGALAYLLCCIRLEPSLGRNVKFVPSLLKPLLKFGGWLSVSSVVGPIMAYADRFAIATLLSASALTYYATPFEIVTRLAVIPTALVVVLFPAFSVALHSRDRGRTEAESRAPALLMRGLAIVFFVMVAMIIPLASFSTELLQIWLGNDLATHSGKVVKWMAIGALMNAIGQIMLVFIQSSGRPSWSARLHLVELPLYLLAMWLLIRIWGIEGAAAAWAARATLDAITLMFMAERAMPQLRSRFAKVRFAIIGAAISMVLAATLGSGAVKLTNVVAAVLAMALLTWFYLLSASDRDILRRYLPIWR